MNHDFGRLGAQLHLEESRDHGLFFRAGLAGIDLDHAVAVMPLEEAIGLDQGE
ncbi:MAG: hypothetical protein ACRERS_00265 [Methylococcales bacterium]